MAAIIFGLAVLIVFSGFAIIIMIDANETLGAIRSQLRDIRAGIKPFTWDGDFDDGATDMIALLGGAYAPAPAVSSRDMTGDELAEMIESKSVYGGDLAPAGVLGAGRHDPLGR